MKLNRNSNSDITAEKENKFSSSQVLASQIKNEQPLKKEPFNVSPFNNIKKENASKNQAIEYDKKNSNQIIKFSGNGCFVEFLKGGFELQQSNCVVKLHMNFVTFDTKTNKQTNIVHAYMDVDKWLAWQHEFESGKMIEDIHEARKKQLAGNFPFCKEIRVSMGGAMIDGKAYSRQIKFTPGNKKYTSMNAPTKSLVGQLVPEDMQPIVISAEIYVGSKNETGLFVPSGKPLSAIRIPIEREGIERMFKMIEIQINSYYHKEAMKEMNEKIDSLNNKLDELTKLISGLNKID